MPGSPLPLILAVEARLGTYCWVERAQAANQKALGQTSASAVPGLFHVKQCEEDQLRNRTED